MHAASTATAPALPETPAAAPAALAGAPARIQDWSDSTRRIVSGVMGICFLFLAIAGVSNFSFIDMATPTGMTIALICGLLGFIGFAAANSEGFKYTNARFITDGFKKPKMWPALFIEFIAAMNFYTGGWYAATRLGCPPALAEVIGIICFLLRSYATTRAPLIIGPELIKWGQAFQQRNYKKIATIIIGMLTGIVAAAATADSMYSVLKHPLTDYAGLQSDDRRLTIPSTICTVLGVAGLSFYYGYWNYFSIEHVPKNLAKLLSAFVIAALCFGLAGVGFATSPNSPVLSTVLSPSGVLALKITAAGITTFITPLVAANAVMRQIERLITVIATTRYEDVMNAVARLPWQQFTINPAPIPTLTAPAF